MGLGTALHITLSVNLCSKSLSLDVSFSTPLAINKTSYLLLRDGLAVLLVHLLNRLGVVTNVSLQSDQNAGHGDSGVLPVVANLRVPLLVDVIKGNAARCERSEHGAYLSIEKQRRKISVRG